MLVDYKFPVLLREDYAKIDASWLPSLSPPFLFDTHMSMQYSLFVTLSLKQHLASCVRKRPSPSFQFRDKQTLHALHSKIELIAFDEGRTPLNLVVVRILVGWGSSH